MHRAVPLAALAFALAACRLETSYVPRAPHSLALGMVQGEPGIYKDGVFMKVSDAPFILASCSASAAADVKEAATHYGSSRTATAIATVNYSLAWLLPPLLGIGTYFTVRAYNEERRSYASAVDAINRYNDQGCAR